MSLFYDPQTRKVKPFMLAVFVIVPILLIVLLVVGSKKRVADRKIEKEKEQTFDVFKELESKSQ